MSLCPWCCGSASRVRAYDATAWRLMSWLRPSEGGVVCALLLLKAKIIQI